jgi:tetratricopeptide (TPR) repeat protein
MLSWWIAREIGRTNMERMAAFLLLLTLGSSQLFFGYVESYPVGMAFFLAYIAVGLRTARERGALIVVALVYVGAFASHLIALYLAPSFLLLVVRAHKPLVYKVLLLSFTTAAALGLIVFLGSTPSTWLHTFDVATRTARTGSLINEFSKPYGILSMDHAVDVLNELLLVLPIPLLLLVASGFEAVRRRGPVPSEIEFLMLAAVPGLVGLCLLVLPVAAAQDWDLMSMLLVPLGVLGVRIGRSLYGGSATLTRVAIAAAGLGCLLSFVLVNANEKAALRRYETLVGPGAKLSSFGRWYAWECLAQYYRHEHDYDHAMEYVGRLIESSGSNPRYWGMAGETLNGFGRYAEAVPFLLESLRRNPDRPAARTNLGIAYSHLGRYDEALGQFREAVRLVGENPDYHHNLGLAYWNVGARDSARAEWTSLLARWPGYPPTERALSLYFGEPPAPRP